MGDDRSGSSGAWLSVAEAAVQAGITERGMRRRLSSGEHETRRNSGRIEVWVSGARPEQIPEQERQIRNSAESMPEHGLDIATVLAAVSEPLTRALEAERDRAGRAEQAAAMWQERARSLEEEAKRLSAQLALPPTQPESVPSTDPIEELRAKVDELTQRLQIQPDAVISRPWWQRWRRG